jgi:ribonuclease Z
MKRFLTTWKCSQKPLHLYGPSNTKFIIGKLLDHLAWDIDLRVKQAKVNPEAGKIIFAEKDQGLVYDQNGLKVTAFLVDHGIAKPAVGFQFKYRGKTIVFSGDTRPCESVAENARNADLLIHEAYSQKWIDIGLKKYPDKAAQAEGIKKYHSSVFEAAEIAEKAKVKHLVYSHLMPSPAPTWYFERSWGQGASDRFQGKITIGRDLMHLG